ncbi:acyltransferase [Cohnella rhizosphaerae]|uniref:Acyltransferase n=1 Tax=Cohnella rhizosphaerae TaxID=1457232 RepID=A0A9X4KVD2_9BACL|nr:acyltransferase [Cohnella rhizosphaerae]MDG0811834.1 acyltransferase [Cohnella rhizosphaerae]
MGLKFWRAKMLYVLTGRNMNHIINCFRKNGVNIGEGCNIYSDLLTSEPYLITIKNNVTISNDVQFITHDSSVCKVIPDLSDFFGEISIGDNCFIGARSILLPGVTLANNIIVGAGSVVTKSFYEEGILIAGNPAKKISDVEVFKEKVMEHGFNITLLSPQEKRSLLLNNKNMFLKK